MMIQPVRPIVAVRRRAGPPCRRSRGPCRRPRARLPLRAVAGEFIRISPSTNAGRADQPGEADEGLDEVHRQAFGLVGRGAVGARRFGAVGLRRNIWSIRSVTT